MEIPGKSGSYDPSPYIGHFIQRARGAGFTFELKEGHLVVKSPTGHDDIRRELKRRKAEIHNHLTFRIPCLVAWSDHLREVATQWDAFAEEFRLAEKEPAWFDDSQLGLAVRKALLRADNARGVSEAVSAMDQWRRAWDRHFRAHGVKPDISSPEGAPSVAKMFDDYKEKLEENAHPRPEEEGEAAEVPGDPHRG